jgi:hypothetical protein
MPGAASGWAHCAQQGALSHGSSDQQAVHSARAGAGSSQSRHRVAATVLTLFRHWSSKAFLKFDKWSGICDDMVH